MHEISHSQSSPISTLFNLSGSSNRKLNGSKSNPIVLILAILLSGLSVLFKVIKESMGHRCLENETIEKLKA